MLVQERLLAGDVQNLMAKEGERIQRLQHQGFNDVAQLVCYLSGSTCANIKARSKVEDANGFRQWTEPQLSRQPSPNVRMHDAHQSTTIVAARPS